MNFNKHSELEGKHAFLSPSKYHWINYDDEKLIRAYSNHLATVHGTRMHALASECISLGVKLPDDGKTLSMYVNDAIDYNMTPEQMLYYSENCFGTADAIAFDGYILRIHDLKTGLMKTSFHQLEVYAAIFFLEYESYLAHGPDVTPVHLRLYQNNDILEKVAEPSDIFAIMKKIVSFDDAIEQLKGDDLNVIFSTLRNS